MANENVTYSIEELAGAAGVSRRTVRFYVQRGLIPPPGGLGRGRHYTKAHLEAILRVRALQRDGVPLHAVPDRMEDGGDGLEGEVPVPQLVTRVPLAEGVCLEFAHGCLPGPARLRELVRAARRALGPGGRPPGGGGETPEEET
ncbi:MAG: MerR family transcriptional regulator [Acidobacteria bacterium]|nr:MerR family transcriptional regulator [Acidobacteriota bacterium]